MVSLTLTTPAGVPCRFATLRWDDGAEKAAFQLCTENQATIDLVEPGAYQACLDRRCVDVVVAAQPPTQTVQVPATPN